MKRATKVATKTTKKPTKRDSTVKSPAKVKPLSPWAYAREKAALSKLFDACGPEFPCGVEGGEAYDKACAKLQKQLEAWYAQA